MDLSASLNSRLRTGYVRQLHGVVLETSPGAFHHGSTTESENLGDELCWKTDNWYDLRGSHYKSRWHMRRVS